MKIDLHVHTREGSSCALASAARQLAAAATAGLDAIAITDHHRLVPPAQRRRWNLQWAPLRVLPGIEISLAEDVLVLGLEDPLLEARCWTWADLHGFVREREGLLVLAHPFRYHPEIRLDLDLHPPDALEGWSRNLPPSRAGLVRAEAARLGLPVLSSSDAHEPGPLGRWYSETGREPADEADLWQLIRSGQFRPRAPGLA